MKIVFDIDTGHPLVGVADADPPRVEARDDPKVILPQFAQS